MRFFPFLIYGYKPINRLAWGERLTFQLPRFAPHLLIATAFGETIQV